MTIKDVIEKLQQYPPETTVGVFDHRKNLGDDIGEGSSAGVYTDFGIEMISLEEDEAEFFKEQNDREFKLWVALVFSNEDYNDEGKLVAVDE